MRLAEDKVDWVVGFLDECWWSRVEPSQTCTASAKPESRCVWWSSLSKKTTPIREGHLLLRALCARVGEDVGCVSWTGDP
jgi:hypothetical protein